MKQIRLTLVLMLAFAGLAYAEDAVERIDEAKTVFTEIMSASDKGIPRDLLSKAHCLVVVPSVKRAGFIVGGQYGVGVAMCRQPGRSRMDRAIDGEGRGRKFWSSNWWR
jgi:lipid-binding SYLF domain-containing protein